MFDSRSTRPKGSGAELDAQPVQRLPRDGRRGSTLSEADRVANRALSSDDDVILMSQGERNGTQCFIVQLRKERPDLVEKFKSIGGVPLSYEVKNSA